MSLHHFIFSNDRKTRFKRHLLFWLCWYLYASITQLRNQSPEEIGMTNFIIYQLAVTANRVFIQIIFSCIFIYILLPRFQQKQYKIFIPAFFIFLVTLYWTTYLAYTYTTPFFRGLANVKPLSPFLAKYYIIYSHIHFTGTLVACTIILVVKYYKNWFIKQKENELLLKENALAELQLLKAQIHPHFLFNTLNNIYALTLDDLPKAAVNVKKLSGLVHYMMKEGDKPFVPIRSEVKMLKDYIGLEKIRYGERLKLTVDIDQKKSEQCVIAPLLLIPFVENAFKHGASKLLGLVWINLFIKSGTDWFEFTITNNYTSLQKNDIDRKKIGIKNVEKRLQLIYPDKHSLEIHSTTEIFHVYMKIKLEKQNPVATTLETRPIINELTYYE